MTGNSRLRAENGNRLLRAEGLSAGGGQGKEAIA